mmetsp:Transcript_123946/g.219612  ORF Transcript_123946/g.219612 Transcript_123946/m.219612 type:complete len:214 (+) Transcript_123946:227-868(+)
MTSFPRQNASSSSELPDPKRRRVSTARYHILYWEKSSDQGGITFVKELHQKGRSSRGPSHCRACSNVADVWKCRLDNMQTSIRMCVDTHGMQFRNEVADFVCLSQNLVIQYQLKNFERYNKVTNSDRLTEETVVGTALKVLKGEGTTTLAQTGHDQTRYEKCADESTEDFATRLRGCLMERDEEVKQLRAQMAAAVAALQPQTTEMEVVADLS